MKKVTFEEVIDELEGTVEFFSRLASRVTGMHHDDAKQEIHIRMWKAYGKYDHVHAPKTYFVKVAKTQTRRLLKAGLTENRRGERSCVSLDMELPSGDALAEVIGDRRIDFEKRSDLESLLDAAEKLIEDRRALDIFLCMRHLGWGLAEISKRLGTSKETVCNVIRRKIRPAVVGLKGCGWGI